MRRCKRQRCASTFPDNHVPPTKDDGRIPVLSQLRVQVRTGDQAKVARRELNVDNGRSLSGECVQEIRPFSRGGVRLRGMMCCDPTYVSLLLSSSLFGVSAVESLMVPFGTPFSFVFTGKPPEALTSQQRTVQSAEPLTSMLDSALKASE